MRSQKQRGDVLEIRRTVVEDMVKHARTETPNECCGLLVGTTKMVEYAVSARNLHASPTRYLIDPVDHVAAIRSARRSGLRLVGFYHSHPDHQARPSQYDLDHAWPVFMYVIIAIEKGKPGAMTSWRLSEDRVAFDETGIERRNE